MRLQFLRSSSLTLLSILALGCSSDTTTSEGTGSLELTLELGNGSEIDQVEWSITSPGMEPMSGLIDTSAPMATASIEVFGLPPGDNYNIVMTARATDDTECRGDQDFSVTVGEATDIMVILSCETPTRLGAVRVNGKFNICAELAKVVVSPLQTSVGNDIDLSAQGVDVEGDDIEFLWTATDGTIADLSAAETTFTCTSVGDTEITVSVSDDGFDYCAAEWTIPVTCVDGVGGDVIIQGLVSDEISVGGAEMLAVSADGDFLVVAGEDVMTLVEIGRDTSLDAVGTFTLTSDHLPTGSTEGELTGVAVHPSGEYALVAVRDIDPNNHNVESEDPQDPTFVINEMPGRLLAVSIPDLTVLGSVTVGRGPDSVAISPDGNYAVVANEDEEWEEDLANPDNRPGTVSFVDLRDGADNMTQVEVPIPAAGIPHFGHDPQPETVRVSKDSSFVLATLQENNAIARIDVPSPLPETLTPEAFVVTNFDAGIRTGFGLTQDKVGQAKCNSAAYDLSLRTEFVSAREPDGIAISDDGSFFVTADEDNLGSINGLEHEGSPLSPHGARSISVYDAATGEFLGDSGDTIEEAVIMAKLPMRCSSKGPEPEVVSLGVIEGRQIAFVSIERSDAITIHDVTEPSNIRLLSLVILGDSQPEGDLGGTKAAYEPEGIEFIAGRNLVVVSNPENSTVSLIDLHVGHSH